MSSIPKFSFRWPEAFGVHHFSAHMEAAVSVIRPMPSRMVAASECQSLGLAQSFTDFRALPLLYTPIQAQEGIHVLFRTGRNILRAQGRSLPPCLVSILKPVKLVQIMRGYQGRFQPFNAGMRLTPPCPRIGAHASFRVTRCVVDMSCLVLMALCPHYLRYFDL